MSDKSAKVDGLTRSQHSLNACTTEATLTEVVLMREILLTDIESISNLEVTIRTSSKDDPRS